jgi:cell division protein FtsW
MVVAWVVSERYRIHEFPGFIAGIGVYGLFALLLWIQPDIGMTLTVSCMFAAQMVIGGMPVIFVVIMVVIFCVMGVGAYMFLPHVTKRVNEFLDPAVGDNYQVSKALDAFQSGGLLGRGPGEGVVKWQVPDSHTDFVFAVIGEEFGMILSVAVVVLFAAVVVRSLVRILKVNDLFVMLAASGIIVQFGMQSVINMGVAVNMLPAKGMTLPFLSYGGSSVVAMGLGMGMLLGLTRKQYGGTGVYVSRFDRVYDDAAKK